MKTVTSDRLMQLRLRWKRLEKFVEIYSSFRTNGEFDSRLPKATLLRDRAKDAYLNSELEPSRITPLVFFG